MSKAFITNADLYVLLLNAEKIPLGKIDYKIEQERNYRCTK